VEEIKLYETKDSKMRLAVLEFLENSEACELAQLSANHLDQIYLGYICIESAKVVGICALVKNKYMSSELILAVRENYQAKGIASRLQKKLLTAAHDKKLSITLTTYDTATYGHVIKFYEKFGFILLRKYKSKLLYGHNTNCQKFNIKRQFIFYYLALGKECKAWIRKLKNEF